MFYVVKSNEGKTFILKYKALKFVSVGQAMGFVRFKSSDRKKGKLSKVS